MPLPGHLLAHRTSPLCSQPVPWPQHRRAWKCCKRVSKAGCKTSLSFDHVPQVFTCCVSKPFAFWQDIFHLPSTHPDRVSWGILDHSRVGAGVPAPLCFGCSSLGAVQRRWLCPGTSCRALGWAMLCFTKGPCPSRWWWCPCCSVAEGQRALGQPEQVWQGPLSVKQLGGHKPPQTPSQPVDASGQRPRSPAGICVLCCTHCSQKAGVEPPAASRPTPPTSQLWCSDQ